MELAQLFNLMVREDRKLTKKLVANGDISEEEGIFRDEVRKNELLKEAESCLIK